MRALIALCTQLTRDYYYLVVIIDAEYKAQIPIFAISPNPPYTTHPLYSPYGHGRSNGWSFLTFTNLRPCTVPEKSLISECLYNFGVGLLGTPEKPARGCISPKISSKGVITKYLR